MAVTISATVTDVAGVSDNGEWSFTSPVVRANGDESVVISTRTRVVRPVDGVLSVDLEPGACLVEFGDSSFQVTVPDADADLWALIEEAASVPPDTSAQMIADAVAAYIEDHGSGSVSWSGVSGKPAVIAAGATQAEARTAIGAGTSSLGLGTSSSTACAGDDSRLSDTRTPTDGSVTTVKIVDAAVTLAKLSTGVQTSLGKADTALQSVTYGTTSGTAAQGNDSRLSDTRTPTDGSVSTAKIVDANVTLAKLSSAVQTSLGKADTAVQPARTITAGTGLTGGGDLSTDRTLTVSYGTTSSTACVGNDSRLADTRTPTDSTVTRAKLNSTLQTTVDQADSLWTAADHGFKSWTFDPNTIASGTILATSGTVYVARIKIPQATTITNLYLYVATQGSGLVSNQCIAGLYQGTTLLGSTADMSTTWNSTGLKTMAISGGAVSVSAGTVLVAFYANQSGGALPTFARGANFAAPLANANLSAANSRWATADTSRTTSLPSTLGTLTASAITYWAAVG